MRGRSEIRERLFAVRGAVQAERNDRGPILDATEELVARADASATGSSPSDVVSVIFTCTDDLNAEFPAVAARELGLDQVPLICTREIAGAGRDGARDPGAGPLTTPPPTTRPRTSTSARRRSCAPTSTRRSRSPMTASLRRASSS